jgi:hypothetical protein
MATASIGTGGTFTTIQAWEDSLAATLTEAEVGQLKNESFSGDVSFSGVTTSGTNTITLECEAGASFRDHANKATNALYPTTSYGAIIANSGTYNTGVLVTISNVTIRNIQILRSGSPSRAFGISGTPDNVIFDSLLAQSKPFTSQEVCSIYGNSSVIKNCVIINAGSVGRGVTSTGGTATIINNTIVRPTVNSAANTGINGNYTGTIAKNNAIFGFSTSTNNLAAGTDYNCSDVTLPTGSNNQASKTYASQFENTGGTLANSDFRLKAGADCIDTATTTGAPSVDIVNQTRSGSYDIGAWEKQAAGGMVPYVIGGGCGGANSIIGA